MVCAADGAGNSLGICSHPSLASSLPSPADTAAPNPLGLLQAGQTFPKKSSQGGAAPHSHSRAVTALNHPKNPIPAPKPPRKTLCSHFSPQETQVTECFLLHGRISTGTGNVQKVNQGLVWFFLFFPMHIINISLSTFIQTDIGLLYICKSMDWFGMP